GVALVSAPGQSFIEFARESYREVRKVVWPTRKEAGQMTGLVFAFVVIMALFLWSADKLIEWVIFSLVLGWK
ncbi:preprotein translocase subunit SecE, partial [Clostridioides difficile]